MQQIVLTIIRTTPSVNTITIRDEQLLVQSQQHKNQQQQNQQHQNQQRQNQPRQNQQHQNQQEPQPQHIHSRSFYIGLTAMKSQSMVSVKNTTLVIQMQMVT